MYNNQFGPWNSPQSYAGQSNRGNQQYGPQQKPQFKKSGAKYSTIRQGKNEGGTIVNAWNASKGRGLITATVAPLSDEIVKSKTGKTYLKMIANIFYHKTGQKLVIPCLMNEDTKKIVLKDLSMLISPNGSGRTKSGKHASGYFGSMLRR